MLSDQLVVQSSFFFPGWFRAVRGCFTFLCDLMSVSNDWVPEKQDRPSSKATEFEG